MGQTTPDEWNVRCTACEELLVEAEQALESADNAIGKQADTIQYLENYNARLQRSLEVVYEEVEEQEAWYNSKALWLVIGAGVGAAVMHNASGGK